MIKYKGLSNEAIITLAKGGDDEAKEYLFIKNEKYPRHFAKKFNNLGYDLDDLLSVGAYGMLKAYNTFDVDKGIKFATYAARIITNEILMYDRRNKKHKIVISIQSPVNIDTEGNELTLEDVEGQEDLGFEDLSEYGAVKSIIDEWYETANHKYRKVFKMMFIEGKRQRQVSKEIGMTQSYVSRMATRIQKELRKIAAQSGAEIIDGAVIGTKLMKKINKRRKEEREMANRKINIEKLDYLWKHYKSSKKADFARFFNVSSPTIYNAIEKIKRGKYGDIVPDATAGVEFENFMACNNKSGPVKISFIEPQPPAPKEVKKEEPKEEVTWQDSRDELRFEAPDLDADIEVRKKDELKNTPVDELPKVTTFEERREGLPPLNEIKTIRELKPNDAISQNTLSYTGKSQEVYEIMQGYIELLRFMPADSITEVEVIFKIKKGEQ